MIVSGKWTTYEVESNGTYYQGSGRNWMERMGCSLEEVFDYEHNKPLIDALESAVIDYEVQNQSQDV